MSLVVRTHLTPRQRLVDVTEFDSILREHEIFVSLRVGVGRTIPRYITAHDMRCDGQRLMDIDFTGSDLTRSTFVGADLTRAIFYCATLTQCDLRDATLHCADLRGSTLAGTLLAGAILDDADLRAATLVPAAELDIATACGLAGLHGSSMDRARMDGLCAQGVDFANSSLRGAKLRNANLRNSNFTNANLASADLTGARLDGVTLQGAILTGVDVASLNLPPETLSGCVMDATTADFARAGDIRTILDEAELLIETVGECGARGRLEGLDIRVAAGAFRNRILGGLSAPKVIGVSVDFSGSQLQGAIFDGADLRQANFRGADLRGASFIGANLAHANLTAANINPLTLPGGGTLQTRFDGAMLDGTGVRQLQPQARTPAS